MNREDTRSTDVWARYEPTPEAPWDLRRVVHLHRRAGFAASWDEIQRDLEDGPEASIDRLLKARPATGCARARGVRADRRRPGRGRGRLQRPGTAQGVVVLPDALLPRPARRAADPDVAQPLRHQQPQGRRPVGHAAPERHVPPPGPQPFGELLEPRSATRPS